MTRAEFLAFERAADEKHEYIGGEVFAMAGPSLRHNRIVGNLIITLGQALRGGRCQVFPSDLRLWVPALESYTYPDVSVVCGDVLLEEGTTDVVTNPTVLIEVLSESTERHDRGDKAVAYRQIPALKDHLLVDQRREHVAHFARQAEGAWLLREVVTGGLVRLTGVEATLDLAEIYGGAFELPGS
jgi:Uma2 family endonuclease